MIFADPDRRDGKHTLMCAETFIACQFMKPFLELRDPSPANIIHLPDSCKCVCVSKTNL